MSRFLSCSGIAFFLSLGVLILGCAEERPSINRVQPNALDKSQFEGQWHFQRTVVDVPASNGFTFVGHTDHSGMSRVTFDIQEDVLYVRRTTELIKNADNKQKTGAQYKGEVIAAFAIEKHFDIVQAYNPTTGEQLNIVEENSSDRPWYQRQYMRVNWSENRVHNYQLNFEAETIESVPYYPQHQGEEGEPNPDAPYFEADGSYFDVTSKIFAKAGSIEFPGYGTIPLCWLRGEEFTECGAGEFSIRNSFNKIDPNHQYEPLPYKGKSTEVFGYFTTERMVYDAKEGILQQAKERYLNRHNLWVKWRDEAGDLIPPAERVLRPIVYFVNRDFPDDLKSIAADVADQWNQTFTDVVKSMGHEPKGDVFILCPNNPVLEGDPAECGGVGNSPRLGDIRYSFMAYVSKYMTYGLLGLGPSNNDPESGEILSGMGYVYHHNNLAAYRVQEMIELLNGTRDPNDFIDGVDLTNWLEKVNGEKSSEGRIHSLKDAEHMVERITHGPAAHFWDGQRHLPTEADEAFQHEHGFNKWVTPHLEKMYKLGLNNGEKHSSQGKLAQLKGSYIEDLLLDSEMLMAGGHRPGTPVERAHKDAASVARGGFGNLLQDRAQFLERFAAARNMFLPEMADDALIGLARELKDADPQTVYNTAKTAIYTAVMAHEVGHSLGLMHNFGGSDDAINYHDEYWLLRDDGNVGPRLNDPITEKELNGKIYNYAYSSVMDYAGRYTIDGKGIGKYDRAAILFGYAQKVEVFKDNAGVPASELRDWYERDGDILNFTSQGPRAVHYTSFYNRMGSKMITQGNRQLVDVKDLSSNYSTAVVDGKTLSRVPYIYCSHNRVNLGDGCLTRDFGADAGERMSNILDELNTWYITRNFPRGKIGVDHYGFVGRWYSRVYHRLKKWHDLYGLYMGLFPRFFAPDVLQNFLTDPVNGWGDKTWAVQNAFNYLVQTLLAPDVGSYGGPYLMADGNVMMISGVSSAWFNLDISGGRYYSTSWSGSRECGYMFWECLHHIGFFLDKIMAIEALSDSRTNFVAKASPIDLREWEVSYYSTFSEQIRKISSAIMSQDFSKVGPYVENNELRFPNYAGDLNQSRDEVVDPFATFSVQLYWQVLGQARFFSNFDQSFVDDSRVFVKGTGAAPETAASETVEITDPLSGLTYVALKMSSSKDGQPGSGEAVINRAIKMYQRSNFCTGDSCEDVNQASKDFVTPQFLDHMEMVKVMADLTPVMSYGNPYYL